VDRAAEDLLEQHPVVFWVLTAAVVVAVVVATSLRVVGPGRRGVVTRAGRVRRVAGPGLVAHLPGVDAISLFHLDVRTTPLGTRARTRDGDEVWLRVDVRWRVVDPARAAEGLSWVDGDVECAVEAAVESAVEKCLQRSVAGSALAHLLLPGLASETAAFLTAGQRPPGVQVEEIQVVDIEVRLTRALLQGTVRPR
jgi:regulator of protease activity HflC (stomatin/prohibitin superfamily)